MMEAALNLTESPENEEQKAKLFAKSLETAKDKAHAKEIETLMVTVREQSKTCLPVILVDGQNRAVIQNDEQLNAAEVVLAKAKAGIRKVTEKYSQVKKMASAIKQFLSDEEKAWKRPFEEAVAMLDQPIITYRQERERKRLEAEARLREQARKRAEEEQLQQAIALEKEGYVEEAGAALEIPAPVFSAPVLPKPIKSASGTSIVNRWEAEVVNLRLLARAVADGKVPVTMIQANMSSLNQRARADKEGFSIPGVRAVIKSNTMTRQAGRR